jgi:hypothetical protein
MAYVEDLTRLFVVKFKNMDPEVRANVFKSLGAALVALDLLDVHDVTPDDAFRVTNYNTGPPKPDFAPFTGKSYVLGGRPPTPEPNPEPPAKEQRNKRRRNKKRR